MVESFAHFILIGAEAGFPLTVSLYLNFAHFYFLCIYMHLVQCTIVNDIHDLTNK